MSIVMKGITTLAVASAALGLMQVKGASAQSARDLKTAACVQEARAAHPDITRRTAERARENMFRSCMRRSGKRP